MKWTTAEQTRRLQDAMVQELRDTHLGAQTGPARDCPSGQQQQQQPQRGGPQVDEDGLIQPRKLLNPCLESREVQDLNKQIKWNAKTGINVLGQKTELEKAMARRKAQRAEEARRREDHEAKSDFQRVLEERAKRIEDLSHGSSSSSSRHKDESGPSPPGSGGDSGHCSPEPESEFLKVHAQLKAGHALHHHGAPTATAAASAPAGRSTGRACT